MIYNLISAALFARREFSCTLPGDVYIRYQSFDSMAEFKAKILKLKPEKIDIGAVFTQRPKARNMVSGEFQPVEKEYVHLIATILLK